MANICVMGSGGWGTAVALLLCGNGHRVTVWSYSESECADLKKYRENKPYLPGVKIPEEIELTCDKNACRDKDLIIIATPSHGVRGVAHSIAALLPEGQIVLNISKGIEENTYLTLSQVLAEELPQCRIAVMSGPSHAEEVSRGLPTTNVVAADDIETALIFRMFL